MRMLRSPFEFEKTLDRLKKAIEAHNLWLIHEIDPQALLKKADIEIDPARQLLFFHPRYMKRIIEADKRAMIEAPLKFVVMEDEDSAVDIRMVDIESNLSPYTNLNDLGAELAALLQTILADAAITEGKAVYET